ATYAITGTPARTDSARSSPPTTQALNFAQPSSSATRIEGSSQPGGATITISSIQSEPSRRSRLSARRGRSRSFANAFGRSEPSRSPRPAAARTAQTDMRLRRRRDLRRLLLRAAVGEDAVEPLGRFVLVHVLGVHQLAGEDLLRLDEHLLLAGRETLLVVPQGEVPDDLGELEDVAGLHLVAVVLEAPVPVLRHLRAA